MISKEDIEGLAGLARIKLTPEEVESLQKDAASILEYVGQINSFAGDSSKLQLPLNHNVLRDDLPRTSDDTMAGKEEQVKAQFPTQESGYNVVRKIIQKDE